MDTDVKGLFADKDIYLCRNSSILWRKNQDGTILALDEVSGSAWALSKGLSDFWLKIGNGIHITDLPSSNKEDDILWQVLGKGIESLISNKLVTVFDIDVKEPEQKKCSTVAAAVLEQIEGPFACDLIAFGACQACRWIPGFYQFVQGCGGDRERQQTQSIVPRN